MTFPELIAQIQELKIGREKPRFIAVSGFGGSGKSTLAKFIVRSLVGADVVPIDDFIIGRQDQRSNNWSTFDRSRFATDILQNARTNKPLRYQQFQSGEFASGRPGTWRSFTPQRYVIVEGCSVLHPSLMDYYDFSVWIDCSLGDALSRAKARDMAEGRKYWLWDSVWGPNDNDYFASIRPDRLANATISPHEISKLLALAPIHRA